MVGGPGDNGGAGAAWCRRARMGCGAKSGNSWGHRRRKMRLLPPQRNARSVLHSADRDIVAVGGLVSAPRGVRHIRRYAPEKQGATPTVLPTLFLEFGGFDAAAAEAWGSPASLGYEMPKNL